METLLLARADVEENAQMVELIPAIEDAFAAYERGDAKMPPKTYVDLERYNGDFRSMPAYLDVRSDGRSGRNGGDGSDGGDGRDDGGGFDVDDEWDAAGVKWVNVHPDNPAEHDLPTVMGTMIYSDPETAFPLSIMDGTELTRQRTGAAAAVATDHLAIDGARSLGIVGAGVQAYTQLEGIATVRPIERVVIADRDQERVERFVEHFRDEFDVRAGSIADAAKCDVLSTVTPVEEPIVARADVAEHTHVNAMGADAAGKHELADQLLLEATIVIDDYEQATHSGEINVPWSQGVLDDSNIAAELGEIVVGKKAGRTSEDGITVFDSTGLAIQDVAAARVVFEHAETDGEGTPFDLLGLSS